MATALALRRRVGLVIFTPMVGRRSSLPWSGLAVGGSFLPGLVPVSLLGVPGLGFPSAGLLRLSRCTLIRRRLLLLESSIIFLGQKAIRLPDLLRGDRIGGQRDTLGQQVIVYFRVRRDICGSAFKILHPPRVVAEQVRYFMVEDARELLYRPQSGDGGIIIQPPPLIHRQGCLLYTSRCV